MLPLKTCRVDEAITLADVVVRKEGCQLRCPPRHSTEVQNYEIEANEIHRGKGLDVRLLLALALSTIQVTVRFSSVKFPKEKNECCQSLTATAGSDVVQSRRRIFDDFFQHLWPYIGNNTANVVFQMVKRLWLIRIDQ
ncbi:hypothetical protein TNCV_3060191 [Trichonephila clavipes]|uniref:Uncharacterized protein n=1 Tax=Trichonephila clavipes TaxID=2585209 RepID=A0A8X6W0G8_TRICX|nr:hypothetical protein TNCV_3060191 [Trichonephila clavipes]